MNDLIKVVMADPMSKEALAPWQEKAPQYGIEVSAPESSSLDELVPLLANAHALVTQYAPITEELLQNAPKLKMIQKEGGYPDHIDLEAVKKRKIFLAIYSMPSSVAVAEHGMTLMLACAKKIVTAHSMTINGSYRDLGIEPFVTSQKHHYFQWMQIPDLKELDGMTLGLFGFGSIGQEIAKRAKAFNMNIIYYKRHQLEIRMEKYFDVTYVSKDDLFMQSDFVIIVVPLTPDTEKIVGEKEFNLMKPSAYFINVCRGGVIDETALVNAVKTGKIIGAGLDVYIEEPVPYDHPFLQLENVTLTPHIAGGKGGGRLRQIQSIFDNIYNYFNELPIKHAVDL